MIVYQVNGLFSGRKRFVKRRTSDKNKRFYDNFHKRRGQSYWWKNVDEKDTNTVQEHM
jgi:hypothetical protein